MPPVKPPSPPSSSTALAEVIRMRAVVRYEDEATTDVLSEVQQAALGLLLDGKDYQEIATILNIRTATIHRWVNEPLFTRALVTAQGRRRKLVQLELERAGLESVRALADIVGDKAVSASVRVKAAATVLDRMGDTTDTLPKQAAGREDGLATLLAEAGVVLPPGFGGWEDAVEVVAVEAQPARTRPERERAKAEAEEDASADAPMVEEFNLE